MMCIIVSMHKISDGLDGQKMVKMQEARDMQNM